MTACSLDIDTLTGPAASPEHCGKPMRWAGSKTRWEGPPGDGGEQTISDWTCTCGASLRAIVSVPS